MASCSACDVVLGARQSARSDEMESLDQAKAMLSGAKVLGGGGGGGGGGGPRGRLWILLSDLTP